MKFIVMVLMILSMSSCSTVPSGHGGTIEKCVHRFLDDEVPPLKAELMCSKIYQRNRDLQEEK